MFICGRRGDKNFLFTQPLQTTPIGIQPANNVITCAAKKEGSWGLYSALCVGDGQNVPSQVLSNTFNLLFEVNPSSSSPSVDVSDDDRDVDMAILFVASCTEFGVGASLDCLIIYNPSFDGTDPLFAANEVMSDFIQSGFITIPAIVHTEGEQPYLTIVADDGLHFNTVLLENFKSSFLACLGRSVPVDTSLTTCERANLYTVNGEVEDGVVADVFDGEFGISQHMGDF